MIYTFSFEYSSDANSRLIYEFVRAGLGSCGAQLDGWLRGPPCRFFTITRAIGFKNDLELI